MTPPIRKSSPDAATTTAEFPRDSAADATQNRRVERALVKRACGYKVSLRKTFKLKRVEYDPDTGKKVAEVETLVPGTDEVHVPADLRASAYWLNNRDPLHWKEDPAVSAVDADDGTPTEDGGQVSGGVVEIAAVALPDAPPTDEGV